MFKKSFFLIIFFCLVVLAMASQKSLAARPTELIYPDIPGLTIRPTTVKTLLPEYIVYLYSFLIFISGFVCFGALLYGGVRYLTSVGNASAQQDAQSQILAAFLGMGIVLFSFLLGQTIDPKLVIPHAGIQVVQGVTVFEGLNCATKAATGEDLKSIETSRNIGDLEFSGQSYRFASQPGELQMIAFELPYFTIIGLSTKIEAQDQECHNFNLGHDVKSIQLVWQLPGIYLCDQPLDSNGNCPAKDLAKEQLLPADTALLEDDFNDKVKGLRVKQPNDPSTRYGFVLHEHADWQGTCSWGGRSIPDLAKETIGYKTSSVTTFIYDPSPRGPESGGVWLCDQVDPQRPSLNPDGSINNPSDCFGPDAKFSPDPFQATTVSSVINVGIFNNSISSIIIDGNYLAILFDDFEFKGKCQVFESSDANFRDDPIGRCNCALWACSDCLSSFVILPTK